MFVVEIPKRLILNDQDGTSLVLDKGDFDDQDGKSFFSSTGLEPQEDKPKKGSGKEKIQGAVDSTPSVSTGAACAGMASSLLGGEGPGEDVADSLGEEQMGSTNSAAKNI